MRHSEGRPSAAQYFANHDRRTRFPWSLYHRPISRKFATIVRGLGEQPRVLVVGCGLEPWVPGVPDAAWYACDLDERAIDACKRRFRTQRGRLAVCPSVYELPSAPAFLGPFDAVVAKDVIEHVEDPARWGRALASRLRVGGRLVFSTPNYGRYSTLALLEKSVLEAIAWTDGYSRRHIHPSPFDAQGLQALDVGPDMEPDGVVTTWNRWALVATWRRAR
jgi:SAM-dependent methyltransferase